MLGNDDGSKPKGYPLPASPASARASVSGRQRSACVELPTTVQLRRIPWIDDGGAYLQGADRRSGTLFTTSGSAPLNTRWHFSESNGLIRGLHPARRTSIHSEGETSALEISILDVKVR
jgi:hypothetical protein